MEQFGTHDAITAWLRDWDHEWCAGGGLGAFYDLLREPVDHRLCAEFVNNLPQKTLKHNVLYSTVGTRMITWKPKVLERLGWMGDGLLGLSAMGRLTAAQLDTVVNTKEKTKQHGYKLASIPLNGDDQVKRRVHGLHVGFWFVLDSYSIPERRVEIIWAAGQGYTVNWAQLISRSFEQEIEELRSKKNARTAVGPFLSWYITEHLRMFPDEPICGSPVPSDPSTSSLHSTPSTQSPPSKRPQVSPPLAAPTPHPMLVGTVPLPVPLPHSFRPAPMGVTATDPSTLLPSLIEHWIFLLEAAEAAVNRKNQLANDVVHRLDRALKELATTRLELATVRGRLNVEGRVQDLEGQLNTLRLKLATEIARADRATETARRATSSCIKLEDDLASARLELQEAKDAAAAPDQELPSRRTAYLTERVDFLELRQRLQRRREEVVHLSQSHTPIVVDIQGELMRLRHDRRQWATVRAYNAAECALLNELDNGEYGEVEAPFDHDSFLMRVRNMARTILLEANGNSTGTAREPEREANESSSSEGIARTTVVEANGGSTSTGRDMGRESQGGTKHSSSSEGTTAEDHPAAN
jgi:hypothetical protein